MDSISTINSKDIIHPLLHRKDNRMRRVKTKWGWITYIPIKREHLEDRTDFVPEGKFKKRRPHIQYEIYKTDPDKFFKFNKNIYV